MNKMQFPLVLGVSARHAHLCREHMNILFGEGSELHPKKYIGQPGQYSSEEQITLVTAKGEMKLRIIGPLRKYTQLELSFTDARKVGLNPPIRNSGDIKESAGGKLVGPKGEVEITEGVIIAARHIHLYPETAETYGLKDGDIVSLDAGTIYKGYHSDAARTWAVGNVSPEAQKLMDVTKQCFYEGIKFAKAGNHLNDISTAIQAYAEKFGYGVVRELVGHGIGTHLHEDPEVPNFATKRRGILLQPGMTLAIEPMINAGTPDDWTVVTADHALSAHYENTILITEGEPEILSLRPGLE